ncbi:DNA-formamidopyrimidine glycosylase family protein [Thioalkalivibrio sp. HK1]|uniref:DNA-formamidopyrimidine glycosylase family protein n=1 Tax=Thioalkalivibrio sp. HK1 TaxID=1469245 RepID=UPI00046E68BF|nr:DNA-formamidopyrimidine glycosylase family protein [Thioalkalivibrio sp. HK1]
MPELPEVERGRRLAQRIAEKRTVVRVFCTDDPIVFAGTSARRWRRALEGRRVEAVRRWGKRIWFTLDAAPHPIFHFGMSGGFETPGIAPLSLRTGPRTDKGEDRWPPRFVKILLRFDDGGELAMFDARRLGSILLRNDPENEAPIADLGFDPLLAMPDPAAFFRLLQHRRRAIKGLLLDQSFAAGVGNWIADEALYQAGIDPRCLASTLTESRSRRLRSRLLAIVRKAVEVDADSQRYPRTWLFHHRWGRNPNARSARGEAIEYLNVAGRTTAWVPSAQR